MARVPASEIERIKREVPVAALAEARGVKLAPHGANLIGLCPFHDDKEPSLVITPSKNLWHCMGACQCGGSVIDWVMKAEGVSFRHAVEILRAMLPGHGEGPSPTPTPTLAGAVRLSGCALDRLPADPDDAALLLQVVRYYHETLKQSPEALRYLQSRGLGCGVCDSDPGPRATDPSFIDHFQLGFANRTLAYRLPERETKEGQGTRERLQRLGILRASGHEHLTGCITIAIFDEKGQVAGMYGRRIRPNLNAGTPVHLYLPGPHRGVWNEEALAASKEIILCEALLDALTFWCAGFRNVTAAYGVSGFTADHWEAFKRHGTERVLIAYDRDDAGDKAAAALAERLATEGIDCRRVLFPRGMDANAYARKVTPAAKSLAVILRAARGNGHWSSEDDETDLVPDSPPAAAPEPAEPPTSFAADSSPSSPASQAPDEAPASPAEPAPPEPLASPSLAAALVLPPTTNHEPPTSALPPSTTHLQSPTATSPASPVASASRCHVGAEVKDNEVVIPLGDRRWRVRGLGKNTSFEALKVNVLVGCGEAFHIDTLDLYSAKHRASFTKEAATELGVKEDILRKDLAKVLVKLEELQEEVIRKALEPQDDAVPMTDEERAEALALLKDPKLLERIGADFEACGLVGEEVNRLVGYLAAVSRKLDQPLAIIIQSSSAAGKSALMEAILSLMPEEERVQYSAMTGQSLFYMEGTSLKHKILAIAEEKGAEKASYALKLLQSEGKLSIASTGKDPTTGKLVTHEYHVEGPVALIITTTAIDIDEELLNRCLVLTVDEGREQTRAIHRLQRHRRTLEGMLEAQTRPGVLALHQNAQRLLAPLAVVNRYAPRLTFLDNAPRTRRDHEKYLTLIDAVALLFQYQRPIRTGTRAGKEVRYVEVSLEDIACANRIAAEVLGRSLDELPPQTRQFLKLLLQMVTEGRTALEVEQSDYRFSRRAVLDATGWSYPQVRKHLERLLELEYVLAHRGSRGQSFVYELLWDGKGQAGERFVVGLIDAETLRKGPGTIRSLTPSEPTLTPSASKFDPPLTRHLPPFDPPLTPGRNPTLEPRTPDFEAEAPKNAYRAPKVGPGNGTRSRTDEGGSGLSVLGCGFTENPEPTTQNGAAP